MVSQDALKRHRARAINPEHPRMVGLVSGIDTFFQCTEALNPYYDAIPELVQSTMDKVGAVTGRHHKIFEYKGAEDAEHVVVLMGSGSGPMSEAVEYLNKQGHKVGCIDVKLFRPFSEKHLRAALPATCKRVTVLDRCKEATAGEPLYLDVVNALKCVESDRSDIEVYGGKYAVSGKNFNPSHAVTIYQNMAKETPMNHFSVGIVDDVTYRSLPLPEIKVDAVPEGTVQCLFYGLGADGTVGANHEAISLISDFIPLVEDYEAKKKDEAHEFVPDYLPGTPFGDRERALFCQGYFAYDAKKSGGLTVSHLRFGANPITSQYEVDNADYIACHNPSYVNVYDMVAPLRENGVFVINSSMNSVEEMNASLPASMRVALAKKNARLYNIDALAIAEACGLGQRVNMIMQTAFFALSRVLPLDDAITLLKDTIAKKYGRKGQKVVDMNCAGLDNTLAGINEIKYDRDEWLNLEVVPAEADMTRPEFVREWCDFVSTQKGNDLTVSEAGRCVYDHYPGGTTQYEKRGIAVNVPVWDEKKCIQCGMCAAACPHAVIRASLIDKDEAKALPKGTKMVKAKGRGVKGLNFAIQASPLDCTGCGVCANTCPTDALHMERLAKVGEEENAAWEAMQAVSNKGDLVDKYTVKGSALQEPLLEFHGACPGCGETPYATMLTRLFGERLVVANASGCSVVWAGTTGFSPYTVNDKQRGPGWSNSLFEDNAEFGFGLHAAAKARREMLMMHVENALAAGEGSPELRKALEHWMTVWLKGDESREAADAVQAVLPALSNNADMQFVIDNADMLTKQSTWILGGDGWAYDIGFGGLDHVLASGEDVNVIVLDTNVYSNTGGQKSKATPIAAVAKFAAGGVDKPGKDLGRMMMTYGNVFVASCAFGADMAQSITAFKEAEAYPGPSIVICHAPCINWGIRGGEGTKPNTMAMGASQ
ncbi:hypothetical protein KIPB_009356, partial [Kipferlia bialata]|eukprot:g9356.t1